MCFAQSQHPAGLQGLLTAELLACARAPLKQMWQQGFPGAAAATAGLCAPQCIHRRTARPHHGWYYRGCSRRSRWPRRTRC